MEPPPPAQRVAVVCASNMNRSMEAHRVFAAAGANVRAACGRSACLGLIAAPDAAPAAQVRSFGVGQHVKLPGCVHRGSAQLGRAVHRSVR
jgi:hypothetical protein